jgi:hypothetical protein
MVPDKLMAQNPQERADREDYKAGTQRLSVNAGTRAGWRCSGSMFLGCLASMKNANPRDQGGKLITPKNRITTVARANEDLDRRNLVDVLPGVFNSCLQRDKLLVRSAGEPAMNCDRSGRRIHQHLFSQAPSTQVKRELCIPVFNLPGHIWG